jgi:hypothetical protein
MTMKHEEKKKNNKKLFLQAIKVKKEVGVARQSKSSYSCTTGGGR